MLSYRPSQNFKNPLLLLVYLFLIASVPVFAQSDFPYTIRMDTFRITGLPGIHSYAYAQDEGRWLILGGRLDGIHARQPFNAFPASSNNSRIYVVDPEAGRVWEAGLEGLPSELQHQLQSTNMQFFQDGKTLILAGGYGYNPATGDHQTYPFVVRISVPELVKAIVENKEIKDSFRQIHDEKFAVTGGQLGKINDFYYLVGGHRFDGMYNPMNMPTFTQEYTNAIKIFQLSPVDQDLSVIEYNELFDPVHLHRRDYNLIPQIFPGGQYGYTLFAGVFQINEDLPFLYPVDITDGAYFPRPEFNQYLNHYHTAHIPLYETESGNMHNLFFGGISQYYYLKDQLLNDELVPFVRTISRVSRAGDGRLEEVRLPVEMPGYFGAGAEFIMNEDLSLAAPGIVELPDNRQEEFLLGYIYGGINSEKDNVFFFNNTSQSSASALIFRVYLEPTITSSIEESSLDGYHPFEITALPNPNNSTSFYLNMNTPEAGQLEVFATDGEGKLIINKKPGDMLKGENQVFIQMEKQARGVHFITAVLNGKFTATSKMIFQ